MNKRFVDKLRGFVTHRVDGAIRRLADTRLSPRVFPETMPSACMRCGHDQAYRIGHRVAPDFDLSKLPENHRAALGQHQNGICANCGLHQAYIRFDMDLVGVINRVGKDALTTDETYHSYPVPSDFIDRWYGDTIETERRRLRKTLDELNLQPKRILLLRYWFGRQFPMLVEEFGAEVSGVEMSDVCIRHVAEHYPYVKQYAGALNGLLSGEAFEDEPFDGVISQHIVAHSIDVPDLLRKLRHLVRAGGFVILSSDRKFAPNNPFHKSFPSEFQITSMMLEVFDEVYKLDQTGIIRQEDWQTYSGDAREYIGVVR